MSLLSSFLPDTGEPLQERVWQRQYAAGAWNNSDGRLSVTVVLLPVVIKYSAQRLFRLSLNDCQGWRGTTLRGLLNTSTSWSLLLPFFLLFMCLFEIIFIKSFFFLKNKVLSLQGTKCNTSMCSSPTKRETKNRSLSLSTC